ncbi:MULTISPECIES: hydroxymethylbilane synthase [unclassified Parafrankia]|uniref:hydroxymethylbilane synthase n=1 Tax=unclassified Parafrankia TaxID=2994368 RepID=UPI000DA4C052|nr:MULTISPECIES: hydroxymethylbilane synthase [unclassified Parafrankia]TCJ37893.1 hydroxymethylbilane synthase [Parafrankia sp. BMG5.11]SQD93593.1 porphobilinogen deaminase (hydroxymethylbilane synthase) [Parafrankia sp. Ea1.12]
MTVTRGPEARAHALLARRPLRLGTRRSALARAQSEKVAETLRTRLSRPVELVPIVTAGDQSQVAITQIGGTGVFVSALRDALLAGEIDLAVHSLKDLPTATPDGLVLAAVPRRADTRDVLVSPSGRRLSELGPGARVGTGSPRRAAQLLALGHGFEVVPIRGNVDTRIKKAIDGEVDAVVLAHAGLDRLDRLDAVTEIISPEVMLPAPGQGALAIECVRTPAGGGPAHDQTGPEAGRGFDEGLAELLRFVLDDATSSVAVRAERAFLAGIEAGCTAPVGALAHVLPGTDARPVAGGDDAPAVGEIRLRAVVAAPDGGRVLRRELTGSAVDPEALGQRLADELLSAGAHTLMGTS